MELMVEESDPSIKVPSSHCRSGAGPWQDSPLRGARDQTESPIARFANGSTNF